MKRVVAGVCVKETRREQATKTDCHINPKFLLLTIKRCVIFIALNLGLFCFPAKSHYGPLPYLAPSSQSPWLTEESRLKTNSCKFSCICSGPCIYNFTTPTYSDRHSHDVLPLFYTSASCNHIVYTAEQSGPVKVQYATQALYECIKKGIT